MHLLRWNHGKPSSPDTLALRDADRSTLSPRDSCGRRTRLSR